MNEICVILLSLRKDPLLLLTQILRYCYQNCDLAVLAILKQIKKVLKKNTLRGGAVGSSLGS